MRYARPFVLATALVLAAAAAVSLARVATAGDRPCRHDHDCKGTATSDTTTASTTSAASTTGTTTTTTTATPPKSKTTSSGSKQSSGKGSTTTKTTSKTSTKTSGTSSGQKAKTSGATTSSGGASVSLVDKPFVCAGPVHLASVTVTIRSVSSDAVFLRNGCTGSIGRITVVQYHGDGIKVGNAHDLTIGGGSIRCYAHDVGKHQDGVQILGGQNVTFNNLDVGCYSANNSQVWINDGSGSGPGGTPTNIVFAGGRFQGYFNHGQYGPGGAYGFAIVSSIRSGARNATVCPNAHPQRALYVAGSAQAPVTSGTVVVPSC